MDAGLADQVVDEGHVIDALPQLGHRLAEPLAATAVAREVPHGAQPRAEAVLKRLDRLAEVGLLPVVLDELRLVVEQVDGTGCAGHEQLHDAPGPGLDVWPGWIARG